MMKISRISLDYDGRVHIVSLGPNNTWRIDSVGCPVALSEINPALVGRE
jgi:hypothetical protein